MSGECDKCSEHALDCKCLISNVITRLEDMGRIKEKLSILLKSDLFESLGKHDPYWQHSDSDVEDKLHHIRSRISFLYEEISDIMEIINP